MITVYSVLKKSGIKFDSEDAMHIGEIVSMAWVMDYDIPQTKVKQKEGKLILKVYQYPELFRERIEKIIVRYFANKQGKKAQYNHKIRDNYASEK